jgi:DMSO/TMAO reductase YedYZ molybdopterin-dependent catalytic subunit
MTPRPKLDPPGFFRRIPLAPHQLTQSLTAAKDAIVLCHLGVPHIGAADWSLTVDGLVSHPQRINFSELLEYPKHTVTSFHECAGSPLAPTEPTRRICNLRWGGVRLADILRDRGVKPAARFLWSYGSDHGEFGGVTVDTYQKDLPLERIAEDVLIAYEMNDAPLPRENGYPARLVVPGFYGTNSVKWLTRITLADRRADGPFTTRWYNDLVMDEDGRQSGRSRPVWSVAPESVIVEPAPGATLAADLDHRIWGWAWSDAGIARVDVSVDGGREWIPSELAKRVERAWQRFSLNWRPAQPGTYRLQSRASNADGVTQPSMGARNAIHCVDVTVG